MRHQLNEVGGVSTPGVGSGRAALRPGEVAARLDRLPPSPVHWRLCLLTQAAWTFATGGCYVAYIYPYVWSTNFGHLQFGWLNAVQLGLGIVIGEFLGGTLGYRIGRRKTLVLGSVLAAAGVISAAAVAPNYAALMITALMQAIGIGFVVSINAAYQHEIVPPHYRGRITNGAQATTAIWAVLIYFAGYLLVPDHYRLYMVLVGAAEILVACALLNAPESPRWLEAKGRMAEANQAVEKFEQLVRRRVGALPEPDLQEALEHPVTVTDRIPLRELLSGEYLRRTLVVVPAWILGYSGIVYGFTAYQGLQLQFYGFSASQFFLTSILLYGPGYAASMVLFSLYNERFERRTQVLVGATVFGVAMLIIWVFSYVHQVNAMLYVGWALVGAGSGLWLFSMYNYTATAYPTRLRSEAVGFTDGIGHIGAIFGPVIVVALGDATSQYGFYGFMLYCVVIGAFVPGLLVGLFGIKQKDASLESISE